MPPPELFVLAPSDACALGDIPSDGGEACFAWIRRLDDSCIENDTFSMS